MTARFLPFDEATKTETKLIDMIELKNSCTGESLKKTLDENIF